MEFILDFTEAQDFDRDPVPAGIYEATVDTTYANEIKKGKTSGTPYFSLGFEITAPEDFAGKMVFTNCMIAGKGAGITKRILKNLGFYSDDDGDKFRFNPAEMHGLAVKVKVKERNMPDGTPTNELVTVQLA